MPLPLVVACGLAVLAGAATRRRRPGLRPAGASLAGVAGLALLLSSCEMLGADGRTSLALWNRVDTVFFHQALAAGPTLLTNAQGGVLEERRFEPFGQPIDAYRNGAVTTVDFAREPQNTLGKMTDPSTGWSYHGARWMAPQTARWLSPDPAMKGPNPKHMAVPWDLQPYQYVRSSPTLFWDPNGEDPFCSPSQCMSVEHIETEQILWERIETNNSGRAQKDLSDFYAATTKFGSLEQLEKLVAMRDRLAAIAWDASDYAGWAANKATANILRNVSESGGLRNFAVLSAVPGPKGVRTRGAGDNGLAGSKTWGRLETLPDHFARHGADVGASSAAHYAEEASKFLMRSQAEGLPTKVDQRGLIRVYEPASNTFGSYNPDGTTRTFYGPTRGADYFSDQPGTPPWTPTP